MFEKYVHSKRRLHDTDNLILITYAFKEPRQTSEKSSKITKQEHPTRI